MKNAKTADEMIDSWQELVGDGDIRDIQEVFRIYAGKMPDILTRFAQQPLVESIERGVLDPKTRELVLLGMLAAMQSIPGVVFHLQGAVHAGASEAEIMEVMFLSAYEQCKNHSAAMGVALSEGFKRAAKMKKPARRRAA
jgi:alkylhydroperoxidase/carboxymuconolactone decarboxylase family protein YurZ